MSLGRDKKANTVIVRKKVEWPSKSKIENSIKPLQYHIFIKQICENRENYVNLKQCVGQNFNVNIIKTAHRKSNF